MKYPDFLKKGDTIGVTACSDGKASEIDARRMDHAAVQLNRQGFLVSETKNCRTSEKKRSSDAETRRDQLMELLSDDNVKAVIMASGGDFLMEVLPLLDYSEFVKHPKWIQGYSDPTGLLYTVTVNCDMATIYGGNYGDFGMEDWHESIQENLELLKGNIKPQHSYDRYMSGFGEKVTGYEGFDLDEEVEWKNARLVKRIEMEGRLLGGCLDVLLYMVGTKYDKTKEFLEKYKEDGVIWYLESFALNSEMMATGLWNLREAGWFDTAKGFVFGRPCFYESSSDTSYEDAVLSVLDKLQVPIVFDACFGHKPPRMTIINGAYGKLISVDGRGELIQTLK